MNAKLLFPRALTIACAAFLCASCAAYESTTRNKDSIGSKGSGESGGSGGSIEDPRAVEAFPLPNEGPAPGIEMSPSSSAVLAQITEIERDGAFYPGLALAESGIRERAGDYAGAAVAAYKELSWAYGYGSASRNLIEEGLLETLSLFENPSSPYENSARAALKGCIAFAREEWKDAEGFLAGIVPAEEEPDSFLRWMLLVCALEGDGGEGVSPSRSAYGAIRARYVIFPEYWYRGARAFSGGDSDSIALAYAEQCINTCPKGPFAPECRRIISGLMGLSPDGAAPEIMTRAEIENTIRESLSSGDPEMLAELFPLMALPDNPYTIYAMEALKVLSSVPEYRAYFQENSSVFPGRLGERLNYISRL